MRKPYALCITISFLIGVLNNSPLNASERQKQYDGWHFHIAPYVWLAGMDGTVSTLPGLPNANIDLDFKDIFEDLDGALMFVAEARKGKWGIFGDIEYVDIESEDPSPAGKLFSSISVNTESFYLTMAGFYRVYESQSTFFDLMAGLRYWSVETEVSLNSGLLATRSLSTDETWTDPLIGGKFLTSFSNSPFFMSGHVLLGGFGVESEYFVDANLNIGYKWSETFSTTLGYRHLEIDYEESGFLYDVSQTGPIVGLSWKL